MKIGLKKIRVTRLPAGDPMSFCVYMVQACDGQMAGWTDGVLAKLTATKI